MQTRSSVLGKRHARPEPTSSLASSSDASSPCELLLPPTPEQSPASKRVRYSATTVEGDGNKENIPPLRTQAVNSPTRARSLRRSTTEQLTPSRPRSTPRRHTSTVGLSPTTPTTPTINTSSLALVTPPPTPHSSIQPISTRVRALLRPTCNHVGRMAGRQNERDVIARFISDFISSDPEPAKTSDASVLYISGSPGTGKTALVNTILGEMKEQLVTTHASVINVNCMAVNDMDALYNKLVEDLNKESIQGKRGGRGRKVKETPLQAIKTLLDGLDAKCLVLLDEIDHVAPSSQALSTLFDLAHAHSRSLRFIGIANTHTLSSSSSATSASAQALAGVQTMHFSPYTPAQLLEIIQGRLSSLKQDTTSESLAEFLPPSTLMLLTKKVAALTGDVRAVFEVLRGAISIALKATPISSATNPLEQCTPPVTPAHVLSALKAYNPASNVKSVAGSPVVAKKASDSETVVKVRELGLQARLVLLAMVLARRRLDTGLSLGGPSAPSQPAVPRTPSKRSHGTAEASGSVVEASQLHGYYKTILERSENSIFSPVSRSEFGDLLGLLETVGLIQLSGAASIPSTPSKSGKRGLARSVSFGGAARSSGGANNQEVKFVEGVRMDEVCRGLGITDKGPSPPAGDVMEEEVRAIYEKERSRITRARTAAIVDAFEDATAP